jgi:hypothetical protein
MPWEDKDIDKWLRKIFNRIQDVNRIGASYEKVRSEFTAPSGDLSPYKEPEGRNKGAHKLWIEYGLRLNITHPGLKEYQYEGMTAEKFGKSPRQVHRVFKGSTMPATDKENEE